MANLSNAQSIYEQLRLSNIVQFEKIVAETVRVLEEEYHNSFGATLEESCLGFQRVDLVADTYKNISIKAGEREIRGRIDKIIIKSTKYKVAKIFKLFCEMVKLRTGL